MCKVYFAAAVAVLLSAAPGQAVVQLAAEGALKVLCSDESGADHPSRTELAHFVSPDPIAASALLLLQYESDAAGKSGRINASAQLSRLEGSRTRVGKLSANVGEESGFGEAAKVVPTRLDTATAANWDIRFKRLNRLPPRSCILILAAVGAVKGD